MDRVLTAPLAIFLQLDAIRVVLLVLGRCVVAAFAVRARQRNQSTHLNSPLG